MKSYHLLPGFEYVYLEDSYVLGLSVATPLVEIGMEVVLLEGHPLYHLPDANEQHCYYRGKVSFRNVRKVEWQQTAIKYSDPSGEIDFGNIDSFNFDEESYHLSGDWGQLSIISNPPVLLLDSNG